MPAGRAAVTGGVAWVKRRALRSDVHFGVNIHSMRRYAKRGVAAVSGSELRQIRKDLRWAFRIYRIDCARATPTMTERRKALSRIKKAAELLDLYRNPSAVDDLLTALDTPDFDARKLAYRQLSGKGYKPLQFKNALRHWPKAPRFPESDAFAAARDLADLQIEALAPAGGLFRDPGLANLVLRVVPIWERVTGRTAGPVSDKEGDKKKCPFADWLAEMHDLLGCPIAAGWARCRYSPLGRPLRKNGARHRLENRGYLGGYSIESGNSHEPRTRPA